jgi:hypothetical protein
MPSSTLTVDSSGSTLVLLAYSYCTGSNLVLPAYDSAVSLEPWASSVKMHPCSCHVPPTNAPMHHRIVSPGNAAEPYNCFEVGSGSGNCAAVAATCIAGGLVVTLACRWYRPVLNHARACIFCPFSDVLSDVAQFTCVGEEQAGQDAVRTIVCSGPSTAGAFSLWFPVVSRSSRVASYTTPTRSPSLP